MRACEPRPVYGAPLELPTAQALLPDGALTPCRLAFCPVGGTLTMVQPAASAGLAAKAKAAPIAAPAPILKRSNGFPFQPTGCFPRNAPRGRAGRAARPAAWKTIAVRITERNGREGDENLPQPGSDRRGSRR